MKNTVTKEMVDANMKDVKCTTITLFDKPCTYVEVRTVLLFEKQQPVLILLITMRKLVRKYV